MIKEIIERSAILIALAKVFPRGIEIKKLDLVLPNWSLHMDFFVKMGIDVGRSGNEVVLKKPIYYDLYQSVPPEIRKDVEEILWKIIDKEPIVDAVMVKQIVFRPLEESLRRFISAQTTSHHEFDEKYVKWLIRGSERFPLACIHCADPPCMTYDIQEFGQTDAFASRVCPPNVIKQSVEGFVNIDQSGCSGCMLCVIRCPLNAIFLKDGVIHKREYTDIPILSSYIDREEVDIEKKKEITKEALQVLSAANTRLTLDRPIKDILDNFDEMVSETRLNWDQDRYYIWVRNCFRELGLEAIYSGSPGKLKRADITIRKPFYAGVEVKSPAEGDIDVGAVRQAADAAREVQDTYKQVAYCAVIGKEIGRGSHRHAVSWNINYGVRIPLIRGRYLLYLLLKHKTDLPQDPNGDIRRLFTDYIGWFGKEEIIQYLRKYFQSRREQISTNNVSLPMPYIIEERLKFGERQQALEALETLEIKLTKEVTICFPDPERTARGGYAVK
jgi:Fe-S-cluster-containing hydrogenase component 2